MSTYVDTSKVAPDTLSMESVEAIGFLGGIIGLVYSIPQIIRLYRTNETIGVSVPTWMLLVVGHSLWVGYGVTTSSPSQLVTNLIAGLLAVVLLQKLMGASVRTFGIIALLLSIPFFLVWWGPVALVSVLLISVTVISRIPQVTRSWKTWRTSSASVVSVATWSLSVAGTTLWLIYAVLDHRLVILFATVISLFASSLIISFELLGRKRHEATVQQGII